MTMLMEKGTTTISTMLIGKAVTLSMAMQGGRFQIMIEGREQNDGFFVTYTVEANDVEDAIRMIRLEAKKEGWKVMAVEECETLADCKGGETRLCGRSGRAYFGKKQ